jgi:hypothetical protein
VAKDAFLRGKMDDAGFIPAVVIGAFNRVRMLTPDAAVVAEALADSDVVQLSADGAAMRRRGDWAPWVPPAAPATLFSEPPPPPPPPPPAAAEAAAPPAQPAGGLSLSLKAARVSGSDRDSVFTRDEAEEEAATGAEEDEAAAVFRVCCG